MASNASSCLQILLTKFAGDGFSYLLRHVGPFLRHVPQPPLDPSLRRGAGGDGTVRVLRPLRLGVASVASSSVGPELVFSKPEEQDQALVGDCPRLVDGTLAHAALMRTGFD